MILWTRLISSTPANRKANFRFPSFALARRPTSVYNTLPGVSGEILMLSDLTIIKAGTGVLTKVEDGTIDRAALVHLVAAISDLMNEGHRCLFVSSGAVGSGVSSMGLTEYPTDVATRQACAAVGQARLMRTYTSLFGHFNISVAQILLTAGDINTPKRAGHITSTLTRLLEEPRIIPIINENDSVAIRELSFGDNDMLTVRLAKLIGAKRVILLTSVDGLLDPETNELITEVYDIEDVFKHVRDDKGRKNCLAYF